MNPTDTLPFIFVILGTISSFILALSPIPMMMEIRKAKDTKHYSPNAFIVALAFGIANGTYSLYSGQLVSFISTEITFTLYAVYLGIFTFYTKSNKRTIIKRALLTIIITSFITALGPVVLRIVNSTDSGSHWFDSHGGMFVYENCWLGVCATISVMLLLSGQLTNVVTVIRMKDARSISSPMLGGGMLASIFWTIYACLIVDLYYIIANGIGLGSALVLVVLKLKYPRNRTASISELPLSNMDTSENLDGVVTIGAVDDNTDKQMAV